MKYRVVWYFDSLYRVFYTDPHDSSVVLWEDSPFTGTIAECEAWVRLKEGGYL